MIFAGIERAECGRVSGLAGLREMVLLFLCKMMGICMSSGLEMGWDIGC